eukprot:418360-Amphidinium_carterae.1
MTSKDVKGCEALAACTDPPKRSNGTDSGSLAAALGGSNADLFSARHPRKRIHWCTGKPSSAR